MRTFLRYAIAVTAAASLAGTPARAGSLSDAENIRQLDIMLMVTGLRCRTTSDNFQPDYQRFTTAHIAELNAAAAQVRSSLIARYGQAGANRALDRMSVVMANSYGGGHPWLSCAQLGSVTRSLASARGSAPLVEAASQLLASSGSPQVALAR